MKRQPEPVDRAFFVGLFWCLVLWAVVGLVWWTATKALG
jgi:hypothetical protein